MKQNILQNRIMRRIYYSFAIRTLANPALFHGFFMLAMIIVLTYFVSIGNVLNNMMGIKLGQLDTFLYNALTNTEAWTLLILGLFIFSAFSLRFRFFTIHETPKFAR